MSKLDKLLDKLGEKIRNTTPNEDTEFVVTIEQDGNVLDKIKTKACAMSILKEDMETTSNIVFCQTTAQNLIRVLESLEKIEDEIIEKLIGGLLD